MKTDFDIHIHVDLGVTPEVVALVNAIIGRQSFGQPQVTAPAASAAEPKPRRGRKNVEQPAPQVEDTAQGEQQGDEAPADAPAGEAPAAEQPQADQAPKELTEQDIREAMHRTRQRIEGENYKDETDGELYQKYHRQLTSQFKNIAALLGADKPSALPADKREQFIRECDDLIIGEDGTIQSKPAPF